MSVAYRCESCGTTPRWTITRRGDVVRTWACPDHFSDICEAMQRDHEITELLVTLTPKSHEWAEISETLRQVTP